MKLRNAFSIIEMIVALVIMVILTTATIAYVRQPRARVSDQACQLGKSELQLRVDEYLRINGRLPSANLRELVTRSSPLPVCPVNGQPYQLDQATGILRAHVHPR
jgi:prepilin-type N-terminal cleavage/methylation domain-containing protein